MTQLSKTGGQAEDREAAGAQGRMCKHRDKCLTDGTRGGVFGLLPGGGRRTGFPYVLQGVSLVCTEHAVSPPGLEVLVGPVAELR